MSSPEDPWINIRRPFTSGEYNTRLVAPNYPYQLFWALDHLGREMMVLNVSPEISVSSQIIRLGGFSLFLSAGSAEVPKRLILQLQKHESRALFLKVCEDLVSVVRTQNSEEHAARAVVVRVRRWQAFLKEESGLYLSAEEQRGLFGELLFLEQFALDAFSPLNAIECWTDPDAPKDFSFFHLQVEIKTKLSSGRNQVCIATPEQLYVSALPLFLGVYRLSIAPEEGGPATSLLGLVDRIAAKLALSAPEAADRFHQRLADAGYHRDEHYDRVHYIADPPEIYGVEEAFPKIVSPNLMDGVVEVTYSVDLAKCQSFRMQLNTFTNRLRSTDG